MGKWKRIGALAMAAAMGVTALAGCGSKEENHAQTQAPAGTESETAGTESTGADSRYDAEGNWTGETSHIVMTLITAGTDPVDMQKVQDAVNEISVKKIGVEVEFKPVSVFDAPSQVPMWIGAGEQIDLMACAFTGISPYIDMNMIEPLEQWLDTEAPDLQKFAEEGQNVYEKSSDGIIYGIHSATGVPASVGGFILPKRLLEEIGSDYQFSYGNLVTLDDLDEIFAAIKEKHPDSYIGLLGSLPPSTTVICTDMLGATLASGALIGTDSTTVENFFASDEYYDYLKHVHSWYENSYILKDAATTDVSLSENINSGVFWGNFSDCSYGLRKANEDTTGEEWTALVIQAPYEASLSPQSNISWTVPVTSSDPAAAVRFLNLLLTDTEMSTLTLYGIEGEEYSIADDGTVIRLENFNNWGLPGINGNGAVALGIGETEQEDIDLRSEMAKANPTKGYGFVYDASAMTNQLTAVQAVITEYQAALETGSVDLDTVYPEFIQKLEANGINEIIADKQAQFDAWLAQQ